MELSDYDVPVLNHSITDLDGDIENAKNYSIWYKLPDFIEQD